MIFNINELNIINDTFIKFDSGLILELDDIINRIESVLIESYMDQFDDDQKLSSAMMVVKARLFGDQRMRTNNAKPKFIGTVKISKIEPIKFIGDNKLANIRGLVQYENHSKYGQVTLWNDALTNYDKLIIGNKYHIKYTIKTNGDYLVINVNGEANISNHPIKEFEDNGYDKYLMDNKI